ncbi:MAG: discoidin domain-containing protein [Phycisphaerales bacterium]|nr:MAG: discoidin domain-containing protein [Phycisphaerales bacterium]
MLRRHPYVTWALVTAISTLIAVGDAALRVDPVYEARLGTLLPGGARNVFRGAKTEVSGHWNDRVPTFAVDGKADSASDHWGVEGLPTELTLDLGRRHPLNTIHLWPYWGDGRSCQYLIEGSADGSDWIVLGDQRQNTRPATAEGRFFRFPTRQVRLVRVTFTGCSAGDMAHVVEIAGGVLDEVVARRLAPWENMTAALHGGTGSIDVRYDRQVPPEDYNARQWRGAAWRGERVNLQAVLWTRNGARQVRVEASPLTSKAGGTIPASAVRCRFCALCHRRRRPTHA